MIAFLSYQQDYYPHYDQQQLSYIKTWAGGLTYNKKSMT
ncbi:hypothetical protein PAGA_a3916 [Pseudoalteromonas agarivorans DSM 14585]|uniref:Uncharacterized protein n=1 Tax=Pseudoalteromonas agarivorans DSM 14585 TaxID=1312369 RepID=A0ACA8E155_9GAMM|nr:hypothetical protein PAGA_a3916 [Pseudoalteromonas agarivorans DSM 14585]